MTSTRMQSYWGVSIKRNGGVLMATFALEFQDLWLTWWWLWVVSLILRTLEVRRSGRLPLLILRRLQIAQPKTLLVGEVSCSDQC